MLKKVLIVEDDTLVAMMLDGYLGALGYETVATCETVASALAHVDPTRIDAAIVDVHLANGELSGPVVDALRAAEIPSLVTTGDRHNISDPRFADMPMLEKPFTLAQLEIALAGLASQP